MLLGSSKVLNSYVYSFKFLGGFFSINFVEQQCYELSFRKILHPYSHFIKFFLSPSSSVTWCFVSFFKTNGIPLSRKGAFWVSFQRVSWWWSWDSPLSCFQLYKHSREAQADWVCGVGRGGGSCKLFSFPFCVLECCPENHEPWISLEPLQQHLSHTCLSDFEGWAKLCPWCVKMTMISTVQEPSSHNNRVL